MSDCDCNVDVDLMEVARESVANFLNYLPNVDPHDDDAWLVDIMLPHLDRLRAAARKAIAKETLAVLNDYVSKNMGLAVARYPGERSEP